MAHSSRTTIQAFEKWVKSSRPGDKIIYYNGPSAFARNNDPARFCSLRVMFKIIYDAQKDGVIALFQRKNGDKTVYTALRVSPGFHRIIKDIAHGVI